MNSIFYMFIMMSFVSITFCAADSDSDSTITHLDNIDSPWTPATFVLPDGSPSSNCLTILSPLHRNDAKRAYIQITTSPSLLASNHSLDNEDEPMSKYQKTATYAQHTTWNNSTLLAQPPIEHDPLSAYHLYEQLNMLATRVQELSYTVAQLQNQVQTAPYLHLTPLISGDELLDRWSKTIPQFIHTTPADALRIADEFLVALPSEYNEKHPFFVQHIFLVKAQLWYNRYTLHLNENYSNLPPYCSPQACEFLKFAQYHFNFVNPLELDSDKLPRTEIVAAIQIYEQLGMQLQCAQQYVGVITPNASLSC